MTPLRRGLTFLEIKIIILPELNLSKGGPMQFINAFISAGISGWLVLSVVLCLAVCFAVRGSTEGSSLRMLLGTVVVFLCIMFAGAVVVSLFMTNGKAKKDGKADTKVMAEKQGGR
jgi:glucan phosphoethanolaminetransferase (alkaline phosphatase superfamily)